MRRASAATCRVAVNYAEECEDGGLVREPAFIASAAPVTRAGSGSAFARDVIQNRSRSATAMSRSRSGCQCAGRCSRRGHRRGIVSQLSCRALRSRRRVKGVMARIKGRALPVGDWIAAGLLGAVGVASYSNPSYSA
jgi:hypothetical protein